MLCFPSGHEVCGFNSVEVDRPPFPTPPHPTSRFKDGSGYTIKLGDKSITYTDTFKFSERPETCPPPLGFRISRGGLEHRSLQRTIRRSQAAGTGGVGDKFAAAGSS